jgi:hypothetical protein
MIKIYSTILLLSFATIFVYGRHNFTLNDPTGEISPRDTSIVISGNEHLQLDLSLPDGGLAPAPGVLNIELLRTTRDAPEIADADGWTYAHHMDLAEWRGRLYAAWNMTPKDEDVPPAKVVYSSSNDGIEWRKPADLFPRNLAWATRFYFYHTQNDKMLAFCAAKLSDGIVTENLKSVLLVREILPDHSLGPIFTLIHPTEKMPPFYESSHDSAFRRACFEALNNKMLLEQQDYGVFLGDRKMSWHSKTPKYKGFYPFGKAFSFFQRKDLKWVGISKMGFVTTSADGGENWSEPEIPSTLIAGAAKVWGQKNYNNSYLLAYNPDPKRGKRFPLVMVHGQDGIHYNDMQVIHGEYPPLRYPGKYKDFGYQYVRGVAPWSTDHSFSDSTATWLIYSVHKEDIWLSRIPLNSKTLTYPNETFEKITLGAIVPQWNIYSPKWAPIKVVLEPGKNSNHCLELKDGDPTDYARALRMFPGSKGIHAKFRVKPMQINALFNFEIQDNKGQKSLTIQLTKEGTITFTDSQSVSILKNYLAGKWLKVEIKSEQEKGHATISINGKKVKEINSKNQKENSLERLIFRTGESRKLGDTDQLLNGADKPVLQPAIFLLDDVIVTNLN